MAHLLHIDSSVLTAGSTSKEIGETFRRAWATERPDGAVIYRDLGVTPVPHISEAVVHAMQVPATDRTGAQAAEAALQNELIAEIADADADAVLITAPMYTYSIPSGLKAWVDHILVYGRTLTPDPKDGPFFDKKITIVLSFGDGYEEGAYAARDHVRPWAPVNGVRMGHAR